MIPTDAVRKAVLLEKIRATLGSENSNELSQKGKASGEELIRFLDSKRVSVPENIIADSESLSFVDLEKGRVFTRKEIEKIRDSEKPMNLSALDELEKMIDLQENDRHDIEKLIREVVKIRVEAELEKRIRGIASFVISNERNFSEAKAKHLIDYARKSEMTLKDLHAIVNMTNEEAGEKLDSHFRNLKDSVPKKKVYKAKRRKEKAAKKRRF
jgi:hypothetical protein